MVWNKSYETGNEKVDNEHKEIFRLVQEVIDATLDSDSVGKIEEAVDFLANYTLSHFKHEEGLMDESNYPAAPVHKKQHENFVTEVLALRERVLNESDSEKRSTDVKKVIINWLADHVLGSDKLMANHYRNWSASKA